MVNGTKTKVDLIKVNHVSDFALSMEDEDKTSIEVTTSEVKELTSQINKVVEETLDDQSVKIDVSTVDKQIYPGREMYDDDHESSFGSRNKDRDDLKRHSCSCSYILIFFQSHEVVFMDQALRFQFWY